MSDSRLRQGLLLAALCALGLVFFASNATLGLASDDVAWLQGQAPTVFDQYRLLPRLAFVSLHALFGPNALAALVMIWLVHCLNAWLVYQAGLRLLQDRLAATIALAVLLINPLTLSTLTWISCFSYVLGTALALLALGAAWQALETRGRARLAWSAAALGCFAGGLLSSHEVLLLPLVFCLLGWLRGEVRWGALLGGLGLGLGLAANALLYDFGRYGVEASRLFSADFALAYASSALSSGLALGLAYPLSFLVRPLGFLQLCFAEPARWALTAIVLALAVLGYDGDKRWRLNLVLALSFVALVTPYILRLYLTPDSVNYHISYALSGRVFYLAFVALALILGRLVAASWQRLCQRPGVGWLVALPLAAYGYALWLYDRTDFLGLSVAHGGAAGLPPRWNPYTGQHGAWLLLPILAAALALGLRLLAAGSKLKSMTQVPKSG